MAMTVRTARCAMLIERLIHRKQHGWVRWGWALLLERSFVPD